MLPKKQKTVSGIYYYVLYYTIVHKIYLKNTSKESWTVESIGADCSCTQLKWDKQVVQSGDYLVLDFTIDLTAKKGEKHNIISLKKSNNKNKSST